MELQRFFSLIYDDFSHSLRRVDWTTVGLYACRGEGTGWQTCSVRGISISNPYKHPYSQEGASSCFAIFLPALVMGNFMVLNLFLALLLNSFNSEELKSKKEVRVRCTDGDHFIRDHHWPSCSCSLMRVCVFLCVLIFHWSHRIIRCMLVACP